MGSNSKALLAVVSLVGLVAGCASEPRFPLKDAIAHDDDDHPMAKAPPEYVSSFAWDGANQLLFRPVARFFAVDPAGPAVNVNALDEVPDSSWFENRIGIRDWTPDEIVSGPCGTKTLDPNAADGTWIIDQGKANGANPGFRVNVPGIGKFLLKTDPLLEPERETGATAIAARMYHAAGYWSPCDSVVYIRRSLLKLKPGLKVTDNSGVSKPFDEKALEAVLASASKRGGLVRMVASRWLPGQTIGPYEYQGTRSDDPNDIIPHEDRRELRGARLMAAWTNHFDTREQNTMNVFLRKEEGAKTGPGYIRHYILDLGDAFGSIWAWDSVTRRLGFAYYFDFTYLAEDFVTLGTQIRPWELAKRDGGIFAYYSARNFVPEEWKGGYPNPAFLRMTEGDAAWMARIIARFTDADVDALVKVGDYTDPESTRYLRDVLVARRDAILRRYLTRLSPLADVHVADGNRLCAHDLAKRTHAADNDRFHYSARRYSDWPPTRPENAVVEEHEHEEVCVAVPPRHFDDSVAPDDPSRYVVVDVSNGAAPGVLRVHLYDLGAKGLRIVGIERPCGSAAPSD
jgi:hypothetical protein